MKQVFELKVYLIEGSPITLDLYANEGAAERALEAAREEWDGPNVEALDIIPRAVIE